MEFLDSNLWIYLFGKEDDAKFEVVKKLLARSKVKVAVSTQVVNEVTFVLFKKFRYSESEIQGVVSQFYKLKVRNITKPIILKASALRSQYQFSFWDSLLVAAALAWQTVAPKTDACEQTIGPWKIYGNKPARPVCWEIEAIKVKIPPKISLSYNIRGQEEINQLRVQLENASAESCCISLAAAWTTSSRTIAATSFSGPSQLFLELPAHGTSQEILYTTELTGRLLLTVAWEGLQLFTRELSVQEKPEKSVSRSGDNRHVAVTVMNTKTGKKIALKRGYYPVSPHDDIQVIFNAKPKTSPNACQSEYVETVTNVSINHPNIVIAGTGTNNDSVFSFDMKLLPAGSFTSKIPVLYTVEYEGGETQTQILPFRLRASRVWLCLIGLLFILPNLLDVFLEAYSIGIPKQFAFAIGAIICIMLPLIYDWLQSR